MEEAKRIEEEAKKAEEVKKKQKIDFLKDEKKIIEEVL